MSDVNQDVERCDAAISSLLDRLRDRFFTSRGHCIPLEFSSCRLPAPRRFAAILLQSAPTHALMLRIVKEMKGLSKGSASWHEVGDEGAQQRVDNYLTRLLKGVPKSHIYRILRSGEVRVNSRRVGPAHRLEIGDRLRLPPVQTARSTDAKIALGP